MSAVRPATPGKTRTCPHCRAVILDSASVCPGCQHHLRFGSDAGPKVAARTALHIEGKIKHPPAEEPWEYSVVVFIRNERDEEVARHVINVGALSHGEERVVSLAVEVMPPRPIVVPAPKAPVTVGQSPLAAARPPLIPPPPAAAQPRVPTPQVSLPQPLPPAKSTLSPPKPGDPYTSSFGRGMKPR
jgi:hypothetical protein